MANRYGCRRTVSVPKRSGRTGACVRCGCQQRVNRYAEPNVESSLGIVISYPRVSVYVCLSMLSIRVLMCVLLHLAASLLTLGPANGPLLIHGADAGLAPGQPMSISGQSATNRSGDVLYVSVVA